MNTDITVTFTPTEALAVAVCLATAPDGPPEVEQMLDSIAKKFLDAMKARV
jgi:hypothetical protein